MKSLYDDRDQALLWWASFQTWLDKLPLITYLKDEALTQNSLIKQTSAYKKLINFNQIIHLGTGGSSLGPQALCASINAIRKFYFFDNIQSAPILKQLETINLKETGVLAVSKSGNTPETLVQLATLKAMYEKNGLNINDHLAILTENKDNALASYAAVNDIALLSHHEQIGGRFAVMAEVGQLPAALMGFDMESFYKGALEQLSAVNCTLSVEVFNYALSMASHQLEPVMFSYDSRLDYACYWFAQLWGESLGKIKDDKRFGSTPITAIGATDQHSQLQLYIDGPLNKFVTFLSAAPVANLPVADLAIEKDAYASLRFVDLNQLLAAECEATFQTLKDKKINCRKLYYKDCNAFDMGSFMMGRIIETLAVAHLLNINPFDQPAVEYGKKLTISILDSVVMRYSTKEKDI